VPPSTGTTRAEVARQRRRYDSPVRRQQAADTRERIVTAGVELLHGFPVWDWRALTARSVAERSAVSERTVYRYFPSERELHDAVLTRQEEESGVDLEGLTLGSLRDTAARILQYASAFPLAPRAPRDPTVAAANARQRAALLAAVTPGTDDWSDVDRAIAAAMFDVLWSVVSFERLAMDWELDTPDAIAGITWVMGLVEDAIRDGRRPGAVPARTPEPDPGEDPDAKR
jgi:AcrR family transcriptional regulator